MGVLDIFGFWNNDNYWSTQEMSLDILKLKMEYEEQFSLFDNMAIYYRMINWWNRFMIHVGLCIIGVGLAFLAISTLSVCLIIGTYMLSTTLLVWHAESLAKRFLHLTQSIQKNQETLDANIYQSSQLIIQLEEQIELQVTKTHELQGEALKASEDLKKIRNFCAEVETDFKTLSDELRQYQEVITKRMQTALNLFSGAEPSAKRLV
ncbi:MAG: hypothetical protein EBQ95_03810 [Gammaproteobacteria bacterium]|nr:hypothetical protein [Gammaproteobacteria bacterium]